MWKSSIFILFFLVSCIKENDLHDKEVNIRIERIAEISVGKNDLTTIQDYLINDNKIYVLDKEICKIFVYDYEGKLINSFGGKGKGPGEFITPLSLFCVKDSIYIFDMYKRKYIQYKGTEFLNEIEIENNVRAISLVNNNSNLFGYNAISYNKNSNLFEKKGFCIYNNKFNILNYFHIIRDTKYNPYYINFNSKSIYALDENNNRIAFSYNNYSNIKFEVVDLKGKILFNRTYPIKPIKLSSEKVRKYKDAYNSFERNYPNYKFEFAEIPKYRLSVTSLTFDKEGRIWISSPSNIENKRKLYVFSKNGKYLGNLLVSDDLTIIKIKNDILLSLQQSDINDSKIEIYEISFNEN